MTTSILSTKFDNKAWSNDEIVMRIRMIELARARFMFQSGADTHNDLMVIQCNREIATWEELIARRQTGIKV